MELKWIAEFLPVGIKYVYLNRKRITVRLESLLRRFFYKEKIVNEMIFSFDGSKIKDDEFINYKAVFDGNIYPSLGKEVKIQRTYHEKRVLRLPYVECIDFIKEPNAKLFVAEAGAIPQIYPDATLSKLTKKNLHAYLKHKPGTYNEPILCMNSMEKAGCGEYICKVGWTHFVDVVRTNLTLDYPLEGRFRDTLRHRESALAGNGTLPPLQDSQLMNFIGVSAVWCMNKGTGAPADRYYYYLKCRRKKLSVYYSMLGTASGYVNPPSTYRFEETDLMPFLKSEILREFNEETGFVKYAKKSQLAYADGESPIEIIPLALTRELVRGGCPQLFFLIVTPYINDPKFVRYFKGSKDGLKEFRDSTAANLMPHPLSPETLMNLLYAYQWMQKDYGNDFIQV